MALQKSKLTPYGVSASYWSIGDIKINKNGNKYVHLNLHISKEAKDSGGQIIDNIIIGNVDCDCAIPENVTTLREAVFTAIYNQIKQQATEESLKENGNRDIAFFSDALDV